MTENTHNNQTPQKKLQMAMGIEKPTADFYEKTGIGEPQFRKWKMFFRGRGNTLKGVEILCDYLQERKRKNGNKLPASLELTKSWKERRFFKDYVNRITKPKEGEDKSEYAEEFRLLGMIEGSNTIPEYISKGLEFFGRIFADESVGIVSHDKNQSKSRFAQSLGFSSESLWLKKDDELERSRVPIPEVSHEQSNYNGEFIGEGFGYNNQQNVPQAQEGNGLTVDQRTQTDIDLSEEAIERLKQENPNPENLEQPQMEETASIPENPPATEEQIGIIPEIARPQTPEIMESQLNFSDPSLMLPALPQVESIEGSGTQTYGQFFPRRNTNSRQPSLRRPIRTMTGSPDRPTIPTERMPMVPAPQTAPIGEGQANPGGAEAPTEPAAPPVTTSNQQQRPQADVTAPEEPRKKKSKWKYLIGGTVGFGYLATPSHTYAMAATKGLVVAIKIALINLF